MDFLFRDVRHDVGGDAEMTSRGPLENFGNAMCNSVCGVVVGVLIFVAAFPLTGWRPQREPAAARARLPQRTDATAGRHAQERGPLRHAAEGDRGGGGGGGGVPM